MNKLVSIIIPVYNVEKYIINCLESLINQTYHELEIIVVNDGSTDRSQKIIDQYQEQYPQLFKCFAQKNSGPSVARNRAVLEARGEYITFVDSDDYLEPDCIEKMVGVAERYHADMVICSHQEVSERGEILKKIVVSPNMEVTDYGVPGIFIACSKLLRRKYIIDNKILYPEGMFYEDLSYSLKTKFLANGVKAMSYIGYNYVQRGNSTMSNTINNKVFPFKEIKKTIAELSSKIDKEQQEQFEFEILYMFSGLLFKFYRKAPKKSVEEFCRFVKKILPEYFPNYRKNKYVGFFRRKELPFVTRAAIKVFVVSYRIGMLPLASKILTRI